MDGFTYNSSTHNYANRLIIARLWNTVMLNSNFIEDNDQIICREFSMDSGVWRRFYYYMDDFWADDSLYFKNGELYVLHPQGYEEFPFYRLKKTKAALQAAEKAAEVEQQWANYRKDKIIEIPYDSLPTITEPLLKEWLERYFEQQVPISSIKIQDWESKKIEEIDVAELLNRLQKMKPNEQLFIRYIETNVFDPDTFELERTGPILIEFLD
jgi:hypothetical protein